MKRLFQGRTRKDAFSPKSTDFPKSVDFGTLEKKLEDPMATPMCLPLDFLKSITHDFSKEQELGRGGFGVVYKGILQNGKTIAVKKLSQMNLDDDRFHNEVIYLIGLKHENIVQLIGYCAESCWQATQVSGKYVMAEIRHRLICFEYLNNKSLDKYISAESCGLKWHERFEIIRAICYGLHYLHEECNIVHLDLTPHNILMDDNMVPKIADFGMSKLFGQQQSRTNTQNRWGTLGYMAPEYVNNGLISYKTDIFSLGVIIIELLIGSRDYPLNGEASFGHFIENVVKKWRNRLEKTSTNIPLESYCQQVNLCIVMGLRCVNSDPNKRPAAWDIIKMLNAKETQDRPSKILTSQISDPNKRPAAQDIIEMLNAKETQDRPSKILTSQISADEVLCYPRIVEDAVVKAKLPRPQPVMVPAPSSGRLASVLPYKTANVQDHYRIGKKLGQGQFGTMYQCVGKADGAEYACKSIPKSKLLCRVDYQDVYRDIQIMHHLSDHPNVVRICGTYEDKLFVHIVMELCAGGELFDRIVAKGHYSERAAAKLIKNIVGVVEVCHSLGVMHRDLKPENFLFASTAEEAPLKATNFGLSMFYKPGDKFSDIVGSSYYIAPEVLRKCYGPEADVWSAGVILYILLCGVPPFWAETEAGIFKQILRGKLDFESEPWPSISDSAKDLVRNMLTQDPKKRFSVHEVLCHPWIVDDAVAPDKPIDSAVLSRLKHFSAMNKLKKMALRVIAESLSEEEIGGLKELFKMIDTDNSGAITFDELKDGLKRVGSELTENEIQALMEAADMDNSGTIDYVEFIAATLHMNKLEREENLVSAFSFFDEDGSGFITIDELSQACREFGLDDVHLEDMIKDIDQNNDGQIDYSEFRAMMRKGNALVQQEGEP